MNFYFPQIEFLHKQSKFTCRWALQEASTSPGEFLGNITKWWCVASPHRHSSRDLGAHWSNNKYKQIFSQHSWNYILYSGDNKGYGLGEVSEENLEALHKIARPTRQCGARLTNEGDNLTDTLTKWVLVVLFKHLNICENYMWFFRLNVRSDPCVRSVCPMVSCSFCDSVSM